MKSMRDISGSRTGLFLLFVMLLFNPELLHAAVISDRVVAYVEDTAITLSELRERYKEAVKVTPDISETEVLDTMVNRALMLREARKIRLEAPSQEEVLKEYIDMRVRALIRIGEQEAMEFYQKHLSQFGNRQFDDVREEIEDYLAEMELNDRLKKHIAELRNAACVQVQLERLRLIEIDKR